MGNNNIGISVVCPTYNSEEYIEKTLGSLLSQKDNPDEIIFSDDGSVDDTISILKKYKYHFEKKGVSVKIIINSHTGPGGARNKGIDKSSYPWIAFLDSDDIWYNNKIFVVKKNILENPSLNCFLHWENFIRINGEKVELRHGEFLSKSNYSVQKQLYKANYFSTSALVCKKSLIEESGGFDISLPNAQDYDLWLKMAPKIKLLIIKELLGEYVEQKNSISARPYVQRIFSELRLAIRHRKKGSVYLFYYKVLRLFITKQWFY